MSKDAVANIRAQGPTMDVAAAAALLGVGRQTLYEAIATGRSPVRTIRVLNRIKVVTESVVELLEGPGAAAPAPARTAS